MRPCKRSALRLKYTGYRAPFWTFAQNTRLHIPGAFFPILHAAGVGSTQAREMRNPAWNLLDRNGDDLPGSIDQVTRQRNSES